MPTFDEAASTPVAVNRWVGCDHASCTEMPPISIVSGTLKTVDGLIRPFSNAAENVTTLFTEPGSNTDWMAGSRVDWSVIEAGSAGLNVAEDASAKTWPVCASKTATCPPRAWDWATAASR